MIKKTIVLILFISVIISPVIYNLGAAEKDNRFATALKLVEMTYNKEAAYQQFMYFGILPAKERYENNPKTEKYSEILVGVVEEVLKEYFNNLETQKKIKNIYAAIYSEEFTEKELNEIIAFYTTGTGKKTLSKMPTVMQKGRQREAELALSPKYEQMLREKLEKLQNDGVLPKEFQ